MNAEGETARVGDQKPPGAGVTFQDTSNLLAQQLRLFQMKRKVDMVSYQLEMPG